MKKSLIIWVPSYSSFDTMKFDGVEGLRLLEDCIQFTYDGASTHERRGATFQRDKILGWSITMEAQRDGD